MQEVIETKENITSLPMLFLSGQQDKEVHNENSKYREQMFYVYVSAKTGFCHESNFHGPFFLELSALGDRSPRTPSRWTFRKLLFQGVLMSWSLKPTLGERFDEACENLRGMFPGRRGPGKSYQGFILAQERLTLAMRHSLEEHLRKVHREVAGHFWERFGWVAMAADGSRVEVPRSVCNEQAFGCARAGIRPDLSRR
jgi:hypothetical protein